MPRMQATGVRRLGRDEARRIAIRAQLLDSDRPPDLATVADRLTLLQLDPTAAVAPSADLVAWSRIGDAYQPAQLVQALEHDRTLFEHRAQETAFEPNVAMVRPMSALGLYLPEMAALQSRRTQSSDWIRANEAFRRRVIDQLRESGPLQSRDIPDTSVVPWISSGWTHERNVTQMLEFLASRGQVAVASRRGRQRLWDLAERVYPADLPVVSLEEARRRRDERRLRALGVARPKYVGEAGIPAVIEGTTGPWRIDPDATAMGFQGRTALLSPFDRLVHDRVRARDLFDFEHVFEMYKPADQRRWGFFALTVVHGDRLVGRVDAAADRSASVLRVKAVHQDVPFTHEMTAGVDAELAALAAWLGLAVVARDV
jgi:uncharacterized protein YcaQ